MSATAGSWCRCQCDARVELPPRGYASCKTCGTFYAMSTVVAPAEKGR